MAKHLSKLLIAADANQTAANRTDPNQIKGSAGGGGAVGGVGSGLRRRRVIPI